MENGEERSTSLIIRLWNNLEANERENYFIQAMIYFPEIFNNHPDKFNKLSVWLVNYESIICPNIRDIFTAGGKKNFLINGVMHEKLPQIVFRLLTKKVEIKKMLKSIPKDELKKHWGDLPKDILKHWANQVSTNAKHFNLPFNLESILLK